MADGVDVSEAPVNDDVPHVDGDAVVGGTLTCTTGNWQGVPVSYAYAWASDGVATGDTEETYNLIASDAGHAISCVVTATNNAGSTDSPSNTVTIAALPGQSHGSRRTYPKEDHR